MRKKALPTKKLISPSGTSDLGIITVRLTKKIPKIITSDGESIFKSDQYYMNLRFEIDQLNNPFEESSNGYKPITILFLSLFPIWTSMNNPFYYNLIKNKNKGLAKRKVTFGQTLIIQLSSILSE